MTTRLFVAFDIPEEIKGKVIDFRDEFYGQGRVRWEKREKLHITAKFLGDTEQSLIPEIIHKLEVVCAGYSKITTEFSHFGLFYKSNRPGILWLGTKENKALLKLYSDVEESLCEIGFEKEKRKFKPHLTILRIKGYEDLAKIEAMTTEEFEVPAFYIKNVTLYESELKQSGSVYKQLKSFELR